MAGPHPRSTTPRHTVLLYTEDDELLPELCDYVAAGTERAGRFLSITDGEHRRGLWEALPPASLQRAVDEGRLVELDADTTLAELLRHGRPDPVLFDRVLDRALASMAPGGPLCAYSDLTEALWRTGNVVGAMELEELWARRQLSDQLDLFCSCVVRPGDDDAGVAAVCQQHAAIHLPAGRAPAATGPVDTVAVVLESARRLLRTESAEQAVGILMRAVVDLGGTTVPARVATAQAIPIDLSLGEGDPVLPVAPPGTAAHATIVRLIPGLVEDARFAADRAHRLGNLADQADTDPLTGLGNRRRLGRMGTRPGTDAVVMADLDHFKRVNDTWGHEAGDRVLVDFARLLRRHLRAVDLVFRLGGEEFLLVLPDTDPAGALHVLEGLREHWRVERPLEVTFSAGVAAVVSGRLDDAVRAADTALYLAKESGRDRFELSGPGTPVHTAPEEAPA